MGKFVITKKSNGRFEFDYRDNRGQIILRSGEYTRKTMCIHGIESVKRNSQDGTKFNNKRHSEDQYYFNLKSFNGKIIGISPIFKDRGTRDLKRAALRNTAIDAIIQDQTKD